MMSVIAEPGSLRRRRRDRNSFSSEAERRRSSGSHSPRYAGIGTKFSQTWPCCQRNRYRGEPRGAEQFSRRGDDLDDRSTIPLQIASKSHEPRLGLCRPRVDDRPVTPPRLHLQSREPGDSIHVHELVAQEQRPGQARPRLAAYFAGGRPVGLELLRRPSPGTPDRGRRSSAVGGRPNAAGTPRSIRPRSSSPLASAADREVLRLLVDERVVHQVQRLQRRRAGHARSAVLALVSAPSNSARNGCRWIRCVIR